MRLRQVYKLDPVLYYILRHGLRGAHCGSYTHLYKYMEEEPL